MIDRLALIILIIGGINWGLVGLLQFDLVAFLFGSAASLLSMRVELMLQACKKKNEDKK